MPLKSGAGKSMHTLPLELINTVIDYIPSISIADLRTLRKVSRTFKTLVTPRLFRVLHVTARTPSVRRLKNVHESDELRHFVQKVVFRYGDAKSYDRGLRSKYLEVYKSTKGDDGLGDLINIALKKNNQPEIHRLRQLEYERDCKTLKLPQAPLFHLHKFTHLNTVHFWLYPKFVEKTSSRPSMQWWIQKSALASLTYEPLPSTIRDISLANLICVDDGIYETPTFQSVVSSLHSLSLSTISDIKPPCMAAYLGWYHEFWSSTVPERFLVPVQSSLTSLSLGGDVYTITGTFNINDRYFPQLMSLKLRHMVFSKFHAVEAFVVKHKATLRGLELEDNGIDLEDVAYYWTEVWERFQTELTLLEKLVVRKTDCTAGRCCQPYIRLDAWIFKIEETAREQKEDADALEKLQATVELRNPPTAWTVSG